MISFIHSVYFFVSSDYWVLYSNLDIFGLIVCLCTIAIYAFAAVSCFVLILSMIVLQLPLFVALVIVADIVEGAFVLH